MTSGMESNLVHYGNIGVIRAKPRARMLATSHAIVNTHKKGVSVRLVVIPALLPRRPGTRRGAQRPRGRHRHRPRRLIPLHGDAAHDARMRAHLRVPALHLALASILVHLALHQLLLSGPLLQVAEPLLLRLVNDVVVAAPVRVVVVELRHGHSLPEAQLLPHARALDPLLPPLRVLVVLAPEEAQVFVGAARVRLHLPNLLAQTAVLLPCLVELHPVRAVPGGHVGHVLGLVVVELLEHEGQHVGVLRQQRRVGVAAKVGLFEGLGEDGHDGVEILGVGCAQQGRLAG